MVKNKLTIVSLEMKTFSQKKSTKKNKFTKANLLLEIFFRFRRLFPTRAFQMTAAQQVGHIQVGTGEHSIQVG